MLQYSCLIFRNKCTVLTPSDRNQRKAEAYRLQNQESAYLVVMSGSETQQTRAGTSNAIGRYRLENMRELKDMDVQALMAEFPLLDIHQTACSKGPEGITCYPWS